MKFSQKKSVLPVLSLLMVVVLVSGCVQIGGDDEEETRYDNGLVIENFEAFPDEVFSGDSLDLILDVQNKGGREATDVWAEVYSLGGLEDSNENKKELSDLDSPTSDFEGQTDTATWNLDAPSIEKGITDTVTPNVRVYYQYSTRARNSVPVLTRSEYKRRLKRDESLPEAGSTTVSHGPFSVEIKSRSTAVINEDDDEHTFRVSITANNIMSGTAYKSGLGSETEPESDELDVVNLTIKSGEGDISCGGESHADEYQESEEDLRGGEEMRKNCEIKLAKDEVSDVMDIPIEVKMDYGYFISGEAPVTIEGE